MLVLLTFLKLHFGETFSHAFGTPRASDRKESTTSLRSYQPYGKPSKPSSRTFTNNKKWYEQRRAGVTVSRKKPPQWERDGDLLYQPSSLIRSDLPIPKTLAEAKEQLQRIERRELTEKSVESIQHGTRDENQDSNDKPFLWGGLSVGPLWKARLLQAGYESPTPIQVEAFRVILSKLHQKKQNVILASATGSGKTLAYLLPLLTTLNGSREAKRTNKATPGRTVGSVWIVTPTVELACQIQRVVDQLFLPATLHDKNGKEPSILKDDSISSIMHVLRTDRGENFGLSGFPLLSQISDIQRPQPAILVGTPKIFLQLRKEIKGAMAQYSPDDTQCRAALRSTAKAIHSNLECVVLDEVDRLLLTTSVKNDASTPSLNKAAKATRTTFPLAEELLRVLVRESSYRSTHSSSALQVICASATIGRSLRRQLMEILGEPSMEKTAILVTADDRTKKNALTRKACLLPPNLRHFFHLVVSEGNDTPSQLYLTGLERAFDLLNDARPSIVFPGPVGVEKTMIFLEKQGFVDIRALSSLQGVDCNEEIETHVISANWKKTPIYVVKERLGRGLDLPMVKYVFLLGVPSNAASYAHLAGRTARNGNVGTAITIMEPKEAPKLVTLAETLGLTVSCLPINSTDRAIPPKATCR